MLMFALQALPCRVAVAAVLHLPLSFFAAVSSAQAQSLLQLTQQALAQDPNWQAQRAAHEAQVHRSAQAYGALLPQVGLQAGSSYSHTRVVPDNAYPRQRLDARQDQASVQASQALYAPAKRYTYRQGQTQLRISEAQLQLHSQELLARTAQAYFDVVVALEHLRVIHAQMAAVKEQLAFAQRNFEIGAATITDTHEAQARHDLVLAQHIAASNDLQVKQFALEQLTGQANAQPWKLPPEGALPMVDKQNLNDWLNTAEQHPALQQARSATELAQLEADKARASHGPTVDMQASYTVQRNPDGSISQSPNVGSRTQVGSVGVVATLPIFAGFALQNRVKETLSLQTQAQLELEAAHRQTIQAVRSAYWGWESAQAQVLALQAAVASSQSALEANQLGYEVGVRINMDVLNAQSQLFQAQKDLAQARYQALMAHLHLKLAAGVLELADVEQVSQLLQPI